MSDVLADRCEMLQVVVTELLQRVVEVKGRPASFAGLLETCDRLREVVRLGSEGVDNPAYLRWLDGAEENIASLERAARDRDADAAWVAFGDPDRGVNLLGTACAAYPGWKAPE
jgi:hypothetical protein